MRKFWKRIALVATILFVALPAIGIAWWMQGTLGPSPTALAALQSNAEVKVSQGTGVITFEPVSRTGSTGLIFYPGGRVDYRSYAPVLRQIAAQGYFVAVPSMLLNLAILDVDAAGQLIEKYPDIEAWVIGGHSLGGVAAAMYVMKQPDIKGLLLWASYPADAALRDADLRVLSIYGTLDGLSKTGKIEETRSLLPSDAQFIAIAGGNHAQFGSYGPQPGDSPATISTEEQWEQIVEATVSLLGKISE
jgi:hypothetical protein